MALTNALSANNFENDIVLLYPNPVQDKVTIVFSDTNFFGNLILFNSIGQQVGSFEISETNASVNLENLASGLYFYQLKIENKTTQGKLLKL